MDYSRGLGATYAAAPRGQDVAHGLGGEGAANPLVTLSCVAFN